jgi:glycosyltransferase involved in cell wall biosynthesis
LLGSIGRLSTEKAQHVIIQVTKRVREAGLECGAIIFGEGPERARLESLIVDLELGEHLFLPGYVRDARSHIRCVDAFLLTSVTEGLPMVVLEAFRQGRPVVASRVGGIPEVIEDGESGLLVEPLNVSQVAAAVIDLVSDPVRHKKLVDGAGRRLKALFSVEKMADAYEAVYEQVTACRAAAS